MKFCSDCVWQHGKEKVINYAKSYGQPTWNSYQVSRKEKADVIMAKLGYKYTPAPDWWVDKYTRPTLALLGVRPYLRP